MKVSTKINSLGIMLLAAGSSTRMGRPKQLLSFKGNTFLRNAVSTALDADAEATIVVLGADAAAMLQEIGDMLVDRVINEQYQEGMASSVRAGLQFMLENYPRTDGVLIMVCDQPYLTLSHIRKLTETQKAYGKTIVASLYHNVQGVPAIFHKNVFPELLRLKGDKGARQLIMRHDELELVPLLLGNIDVDTPEDYDTLLSYRETEYE